MPFHYVIHPEQRMVHITAVGDPGLYAILEFMYELRRDPQFQEGFAILADFRLSHYTASYEEATRLAELHSSPTLFQVSPLAIVVSTDKQFEISQEMARIARLNDQRVRAFRDIESAQEWLGIQVHGASQA